MRPGIAAGYEIPQSSGGAGQPENPTTAQLRQVFAQQYTADTIDANWVRFVELAKKDILTDAEKIEARAAANALENWMKREDTWKNRHSGQFDEQKFMDYAAVRDSLYVKSNTATQFVTGMLSAMPGAKLAQEKASAIASERSVWSDDIADIGAQNYMENAARNGAAAYSWGNITGNVAYLLALSELTGGLVEPLAAGTGGSAAVSSANILRSGLTFGIAEGTREAGEQDWSDAWNALKETGKAAKKGAIKGMVGALAAELTAPGIVNTVEKYGLAPQYLQYAQAISNAAYSAGVVGTNYLLTPAGKKPSFKELGTQLAVSFLFSVAMAGVDTLLNGTETGAYKAPDGDVTDAGAELTELRDELLDMNGRLNDPEGAAHVLEITNEMRSVIKDQGVSGGPAGITLDLLDRIDDYAMGVQPEAPSYMYQYPETEAALTPSAGGALVPTGGNLPAVTGGMETGNSYLPGIAAAGAAEALTNTWRGDTSPLTPKVENPYTALLYDLFRQDSRVPEPVMQNFLAINPNKTEEDIQAYYEKYLNETGQLQTNESILIDSEENDGYTGIEDSKQDVDTESVPTLIKCRNEKLAGSTHPVTGVPFVSKQIFLGGTLRNVVVPEFASVFDAQLPEDMYKRRDEKQFKECNLQLWEEITRNENLRTLFNEVQLDAIRRSITPAGYSWHHAAEEGRMQLVNKMIHNATGHTCGRSFWGGGTECRSMVLYGTRMVWG